MCRECNRWGDFATDKIVPDCVRAAFDEKDIIIRNPYSGRPFQHVLEPVTAYLILAARQYDDRTLAGAIMWVRMRKIVFQQEYWQIYFVKYGRAEPIIKSNGSIYMVVDLMRPDI